MWGKWKRLFSPQLGRVNLTGLFMAKPLQSNDFTEFSTISTTPTTAVLFVLFIEGLKEHQKEVGKRVAHCLTVWKLGSV